MKTHRSNWKRNMTAVLTNHWHESMRYTSNVCLMPNAWELTGPYFNSDTGFSRTFVLKVTLPSVRLLLTVSYRKKHWGSRMHYLLGCSPNNFVGEPLLSLPLFPHLCNYNTKTCRSGSLYRTKLVLPTPLCLICCWSVVLLVLYTTADGHASVSDRQGWQARHLGRLGWSNGWLSGIVQSLFAATVGLVYKWS